MERETLAKPEMMEMLLIMMVVQAPEQLKLVMNEVAELQQRRIHVI